MLKININEYDWLMFIGGYLPRYPNKKCPNIGKPQYLFTNKYQNKANYGRK
jgi:hypothetical protein